MTEDARAARALHEAVHGLRERDPMRSASTAMIGGQKAGLLATLALVAGCLAWRPVGAATVLVALATLAYVGTLAERVSTFRRGLNHGPIRVSDERALALTDEELPRYTILVPAYNEPGVVCELIGSMAALDYPRDKLQVLLLLEADDHRTIAAATAATGGGDDLGDFIEVLLVPPADPRTKPKACNFGMAYATGDIVTIYDAEDVPEPLQLRRAVATFADLGPELACVQAKLAYYNGRQNILTGWFTAEYGLWFGFLLPGLMSTDSPIPLGGTSNHIRRSVLDQIGAWDPFNVTEDADLGIRIAENGYRTAVIDSTTLEEANSDPINWVRQRSRWYKGYLQTALVHLRKPVKLARAVGVAPFLRFVLLLGAMPLIAFLNLLFWLITTMWLLGQPQLIGELFPWFVYFPALVALVIGNGVTLYMNLVALREDDRADLAWTALLVPAYWLLMAIAATKGLWQLLRNPSYWEKTHHGLSSTGKPAGKPA